MYNTFISYNSSDEAYARNVYKFLKSSGLNPFFAAVSLADLGKTEFGAAIDDALTEASNFVLVTSSARNIKTGYVRAEWRLFVDEKRAGRKSGNIVTVLFGDNTIMNLPIAVKQYQVLPWTDQGKQDLLHFLRPSKQQRQKSRHSRMASSGGAVKCVDSDMQHLTSRIPVTVHTVLDIRKGKSAVTYGPGVREATQEELDLLFGKKRCREKKKKGKYNNRIK